MTYQNVKLGVRNGNEYEVLEGVEDGAKVVVDGQARLRDGIKVRIAGE